VHRIARELHLDYTGLKKRVEKGVSPPPKPSASVMPTFLELAGATAALPGCRIAVESAHGTLCLELPVLAPSKLERISI
jgi:hypothetical protein